MTMNRSQTSPDDLAHYRPSTSSRPNSTASRPASRPASGFRNADPISPGRQRVEERFQVFLDRQSNASQEIRQQLSALQLEVIDATRAASRQGRRCGVDAFRLKLARSYGSITAAWRQLLDPGHNGKVCFADFCKACREVGYNREVKQLWSELDTQNVGWISLDKLDPEAAAGLKDFWKRAQEMHGGPLKAWLWLDENKSHRLEPEEFAAKARMMGCTSNPKQLFNWLKRDVRRKYLTIQDFDETAMQCLYRGDEKEMTVKHSASLPALSSDKGKTGGRRSPASREGNKTKTAPGLALPYIAMSQEEASWANAQAEGTEDAVPPSRESERPRSRDVKFQDDVGKPRIAKSTLNSRWTKERSNQEIDFRHEQQREKEHRDLGLRSVAGLKRELVVRFGSIHAAWRQALDLDGNGRLSFGEFCTALRNVGYGGNVKDAWRGLDTDGDGFICLKEFDPSIHEQIRSYKDIVQVKYGNLLASWLQSFDSGGNGQVDEAAFTKHCQDVGWGGDARSLFQNLKEERTRKFLTLRDYDIRAWKAFSRGDMDMVSEDETRTAHMGFHERQDNCFSNRWARMKSKNDREDLARLAQEERARDKGSQDINSLKQLLVRRFGTIAAAWRNGLDVAGNNRLSFREFCEALRKLGFTGNIKRSFHLLDSGGTGAILLRDLDAEADDYLSEFRRLLLERFGSYIKAWQFLDSNRNGTIEEHEMVAMCKELEYSKDAKVLFRFLLDGTGKRSISMADLDPACMKAYYRGDLEAMSRADKGKAMLKMRLDAEAEERARQLGATDLKSLRRVMLRRFQTITNAWRSGIDVHGNGKVNFTEFSKAMRNVGFDGSIRQCFSELCKDGAMTITFEDWDERWAGNLRQFWELVLAKHGSFPKLWEAVDTNKNNQLDLDEFATVCRDVGYTEDSAQLYRQLLLDASRKCLSPEDLDTSVVVGFDSAEVVDFDALAKADVAERKKIMEEEKAARAACNDATSLKRMLLRKYGTITAAFRNMDLNQNGKVSFAEFCQALRSVAFVGSIQQCFAELDKDSNGTITFDEWDPKWAVRLQCFWNCLLIKFSDFKTAWKAIDCNGNATIQSDEFARVCKDIGYTDDADALFKQLLLTQERGHLNMEDLDSSFLVGFSRDGPASPFGSLNKPLRPRELGVGQNSSLSPASRGGQHSPQRPDSQPRTPLSAGREPVPSTEMLGADLVPGAFDTPEDKQPSQEGS
mmetsp:Transcript_15704/g.28961  ORF Transcript_15704/g.28961 Transcript_15704/m.28961 type:complete len:1214 (+) Transcript_15704:139-3780(+)